MEPVCRSAGQFAAFLPKAGPCQKCEEDAGEPVGTHSPAVMTQKFIKRCIHTISYLKSSPRGPSYFV